MSATPRRSGPPREVIAPRHESLRKEFEHELGALPLGYGEARLWLVARDSHRLFAYWEFRPDEHPEACGKDGVARYFLRIIRGNGEVEATVEIQPAAGDWDIAAEQPDAAYTAELGFFTREGLWCFVACSGSTRTPPEGLRTNGHAIPAGLPVAEAGELSRRELPSAKDDVPADWSPKQEQILANLLARDTAKAAPRERDGR